MEKVVVYRSQMEAMQDQFLIDNAGMIFAIIAVAVISGIVAYIVSIITNKWGGKYNPKYKHMPMIAGILSAIVSFWFIVVPIM